MIKEVIDAVHQYFFPKKLEIALQCNFLVAICYGRILNTENSCQHQYTNAFQVSKK